jgi:A/G-specific adenine glycosylase
MEPRDFYAALMDYGTHLKQKGIKLNAKSRHYAKQSKFEGSYRQLRGTILRTLLESPKTMDELIDLTDRKHGDVAKVVANLSSEGIIKIKNKKISILD